MTNRTEHSRLFAALAVAVALLVRTGALIAMKDTLRQDPDGYKRLAETLAQTGVYGSRDPGGVVHPTAYRPPLYPWLLSLTAVDGEVLAISVGALHAALGLATVGLVLELGRRWRLAGWGPLAAALTACDPILVNQSGLVMTETLAALLSALALLCLTRLGEAPTVWRAAAAGGVLAAASLCRPTFLACLAVVAACAWLWSARGRRLPLVGALAVAAAVTLGPWTLRNHRQLGRPIATTTHGGYTLLLGNNFAFYQRLRQTPFGGLWDASRLQQELADRAAKQEERARRTREVAEDKLAYAMAFETIRSEPAMFAHACVARVARLWGVLPHQLDPDESATRRLSRYLTAIWYCWLFLLAALGAFGKGRDLGRCPWLWGVLLCVSFTAVHAAYWSDMRMRAPLMPAVCLLAAAGAGRARVALKRLLPKEL